MARLIDDMRALGYNVEQADVIDRLDDLFIEAENAGLITNEQAAAFGKEFLAVSTRNLGL